jgi:mono/diheme cytochrome c family protein
MKRNPIVIALLAGLTVAVALVLLWPQRSSGPEAIVHGKDACARCRMKIGAPGFAGELRDGKGHITKYDDVGCLVAAMNEVEVEAAWVEDHETAELVPIDEATLVRGGVSTPMGHGIVAFRGAARAEAFAREHGGVLVTLAEVRGKHAPPGPAEPAARTAVPGGPRPFEPGDAKAGKVVFLRECAGCHGERGDGRGAAAAFLKVPPRNFLKGKFRLRTTPSGKPPTTADVLKTIERGLPGSGMPSFAFLSPVERRQVAAWVLERADLLDEPEPEPLPDPGPPPATTAQTIARGKEVYANTVCAQCHGPAGRGDGPAAPSLKDEDGRAIPSREFTDGVYRGGSERQDLYLRFSTGLDGTPMPSYAASIPAGDRWALVDYLLSLKEPPRAALPSDPIAAGRALAEKYACRGCHVLDDGRGGDVGPDLRVSGQKLSVEWLRSWLSDPRAKGKIYPWRPQRMPDLALEPNEIDALVAYVSAMGKRTRPFETPDTSTFQADRLTEGKNFFLLRCTECHQLGDVIPTPYVKQQGPDLIHVSERVDFEWALGWILDPRKIDPRTRMTVPGITREQAESVRMFIWKTSLENRHAAR